MSKYAIKTLFIVLPFISLTVSADSQVSVIAQNDLLDIYTTTAEDYTDRYAHSEVSEPNAFNAASLKSKALKNFEQDGSFFKLTDFNSLNTTF